jgi:hypothetical protein
MLIFKITNTFDSVLSGYATLYMGDFTKYDIPKPHRIAANRNEIVLYFQNTTELERYIFTVKVLIEANQLNYNKLHRLKKILRLLTNEQHEQLG